MTVNKAMSDKELRQQAETINTMATQIKDMKKLAPLWPILCFFGTSLSMAFGFGIFINRYDLSLVKKPEYTAHVKESDRRYLVDSMDKKTVDSRLDKLETAPKLRFTNVTHQRGKDGQYYDKEVN